MAKNEHLIHFKKKETLQKILPIIENSAIELGLTLLEADFEREADKLFLRIFIYQESRGISHENCENLTKKIEPYLDELIPVPYYLEVSSPGLDRRLKSTKEYNIFKGKKVEIKLKEPIAENIKILSGKIIEFKEETGLKIERDGQVLQIEEKNIQSARLKPDFNI